MITYQTLRRDVETIIAIGSFSQIMIGLLRENGPFQVILIHSLREETFLEVDGTFLLKDFRHVN